jgi:hypothetical protein
MIFLFKISPYFFEKTQNTLQSLWFLCTYEIYLIINYDYKIPKVSVHKRKALSFSLGAMHQKCFSG